MERKPGSSREFTCRITELCSVFDSEKNQIWFHPGTKNRLSVFFAIAKTVWHRWEQSKSGALVEWLLAWENLRSRRGEKICRTVTLSTTNPPRTRLGLSQDLCFGRPMTKHPHLLRSHVPSLWHCHPLSFHYSWTSFISICHLHRLHSEAILVFVFFFSHSFVLTAFMEYIFLNGQCIVEQNLTV
jgi:hypothetical protein